MANNDAIERVLDAVDIVEVIGEAVPLKPRGANYIGLCPFHNEKTPSFTVSPTKGIYTCFGCGKKGNVFTFMKDYYGMEFGEALNELAHRYNVPLPQYKQTKKQKEKLSRREQALEVLHISAEYYSKLLGTTAGKKAMSYLNKREFNKESIKDFRLGYSPAGWEELMNVLKKKRFRENVLLDAGLVIKKDGGGVYDRFRDRLMFPIHNSLGKIVGFGARQLGNEKNQPKYINSPQTIVYDKSAILYGLFQGKNEIRRKESAILTEGYADVISLHQAGFKNAVASSGTSLTVEQLNVLKKYCSKLFIVYDADEAGQNAAVRAIDMAIAKGFEVYIVSLPGGEDPDSIIKGRGAKVFQEYLSDAEIFVDFKINLLKRRNKLNTPAEIANAIRDIINTIERIPDRLQHDEYINHLAALLKLSSRQVERIYKEKVSIEKKYGREQVQDAMREEKRQEAKDKNDAEVKGNESGSFKPDYTQLLSEERLIFKYMISHREVSDFLLNNVAVIPENMYSEEAKRLLTLIIDLYGKNSDIVKYVAANEEIHPDDKDFIIEMAIDTDILSTEWKQYAKGMKDFDFFKPVKDSLKKIELYKIERELETLQAELNGADADNAHKLLTKYKDASRKKDIFIKLMADENKA
jgi:DNA primase